MNPQELNEMKIYLEQYLIDNHPDLYYFYPLIKQKIEDKISYVLIYSKRMENSLSPEEIRTDMYAYIVADLEFEALALVKEIIENEFKDVNIDEFDELQFYAFVYQFREGLLYLYGKIDCLAKHGDVIFTAKCWIEKEIPFLLGMELKKENIEQDTSDWDEVLKNIGEN